jgi:hypothetical protein
MIEFLRFLLNPSFNGEFRKPSGADLFLPFVVYLLFVIPLGVLLFIISGLLEVSPKLLQLNTHERIVYGILLTPLIEEIFFRLIYVFTKRNIGIIIFSSFCLIVVFVTRSEFHKAYLFLSLFLFFTILLLFYQKSSSFFENHFRFFFYAIAAIFAVLHIFNFTGINSVKHILIIFFVIPQLILGIILGYLRITYGFIYAVSFHTIVNLSLLF